MPLNYAKSLLIVAAFLTSTAALAHPKLTASTPAADATVAAPSVIDLTFSEALVAQFSGVELDMMTMPGMKMTKPMKMKAAPSTLSADGKTLSTSFAKPLPRGTYQLNWHAVSDDTHRVEGSYSFTVK